MYYVPLFVSFFYSLHTKPILIWKVKTFKILYKKKYYSLYLR